MYVFTEQPLEEDRMQSVWNQVCQQKQERVGFVYLRIFRKFHMHENLCSVSGLWGYQ